MFKKAFFLLLFIFSSSYLFSQNLEFYKEDLFFEVKNHTFYVKGIYYFSNISDKPLSTAIFYPFPIDKMEYGAVDSVTIIDINANKLVKCNIDNKGAYFYIFLDPFMSTKYQISYQQKILKNKCEYILLTTRNWGKPFEQANYQLTLPDSKIESFSIQPDSSYISKNKAVYFWDKHNYMPDSNMVFYLNYKK
jgi:hypothetical protein